MGHTVDIESYGGTIRLGTYAAYENGRVLAGAIFRNVEIGHGVCQILDARHLCVLNVDTGKRCH